MLSSPKNIITSENFFCKSKYYCGLIILTSVISFSSCNSGVQENNFITETNSGNLSSHSSVTDAVDYAYAYLDGYWVLTDYYDNIINEQTIVKYFTVPPSFSAWNFLIKNDSVFSTGLLSHERLALKNGSDTLTLMSDGLGSYAFFYNKESDLITLEDTESKKKKYTYRRVKDKDPLSSVLSPKKTPREIEQGLYQIFVNRLIAGHYYTRASSEKFTLKNDGGVVGFKHYNKFQLYTYFGNVHPFMPYDAIIFEDTTRFNSTTVYSWELNNEILTLKEMVSNKGGKDYILGSRVHKYVKKSQ